MRVRLGATLLALATAGLLAAGPAFAADFGVTGTADSVGGACGPVDATGLRPCPSLRAAVGAANASPDAEDNILLTTGGTYALSEGELVLQNGVSLFGTGARGIRIESDTRVLHVPAAADVIVAGVTIADGIVAANGGNILNEGNLELFQTHIVGGLATDGSGGGIANLGGTLSIIQSLIEGNAAVGSGGGIDNQNGTLDVSDSTFAGNSVSSPSSASAIGTSGTSSVELHHVTFNLNVPGTTLVIVNSGQTVTTYGSIFTTNATAPLCGDITPTDQGYNIDRGNTCLFTGTGSLINTDPAVSPGLVNRGGPTDLFSIETSSPAASLVANCGSGLDQRGYLRNPTFTGPCDAGSYEIDGQPIVPEPPVQPPPPPTPPPVPPVPTATPAPTPAPVAGQSVAAETVKGKVLVKVPGSNKFVPLDESLIKNGAEIDTRKGTVEITRSDGGVAKFFDGIFKLSQPNGITTLTLSEKLDCKKSGRANAAAKKPKTRKLWGDGAGKFRTRGQYSAATIRGTKWLVTDTCTTTATKVAQGTVAVQDLVKKKTIVVRKGKSYTARSRR